jgi:hypothetical protein
MIRRAPQARARAVTEERLSQSGDWAGRDASTAAVATESRTTETVTRTLR